MIQPQDPVRYAKYIPQGCSFYGEIDIWSGNQPLNIQLPLVDGHVDYDVTSSHRSSFELYYDDPKLQFTPKVQSDALAPFGNFAQVYFGPVYPDNRFWDKLPMGQFPLSEWRSDRIAAQRHDLILDASDWSQWMSDRPLTSAITFLAGSAITYCIRQLVQLSMPWFSNFQFEEHGFTTTTVNYNVGQDPWSAAQDIANSSGYELFFNRYGVLVLQLIPDFRSIASIWSYILDKERVEYSGVEEIIPLMQNRDVFNHIRVQGESTSNVDPILAEARISDPTHPLYVGGKYGDKMNTIRSNVISGPLQAISMGNSELLKSIRNWQTVEVKGSPNPALELEDILFIDDSENQIEGNYTINKYEIQIRTDQQMDLIAGAT